MKPLAQTDEEKFIVLAGAVGGAWMAYENGADPARSLRAIWEVLQEIIEQGGESRR